MFRSARMARLKGTVEEVVPPLPMVAHAAPEPPAVKLKVQSIEEHINQLRQMLKDAGIDALE